MPARGRHLPAAGFHSKLSSLKANLKLMFDQQTTSAPGPTTVPPGSDGGNGINWVAAADPRVRTAYLGKGTDGIADVYQFLGYSSLGSPIAITNGIEARLIEAEAALAANHNDAATTGTGWLGALNTLRASSITPAMAPLADGAGAPLDVTQLGLERRISWIEKDADERGSGQQFAQ